MDFDQQSYILFPLKLNHVDSIRAMICDQRLRRYTVKVFRDYAWQKCVPFQGWLWVFAPVCFARMVFHP